MYAPAEQKAFTFAARCEESFLIAKFDGFETSVTINAADREQIVYLLRGLIEKLESGALPR
jgi:hypothetical protein